MDFKPLEKAEQLEAIKEAPGCHVIFKHNTTCPISKSMRAQFERDASVLSNVSAVYVLDLLAHRDLSDTIAADFDVAHESPQLLVIRDGQCINHQSLYDISAAETAAVIGE